MRILADGPVIQGFNNTELSFCCENVCLKTYKHFFPAWQVGGLLPPEKAEADIFMVPHP